MNVTRRGVFKTTLATFVVARWPRFPAASAAEELTTTPGVKIGFHL